MTGTWRKGGRDRESVRNLAALLTSLHSQQDYGQEDRHHPRLDGRAPSARRGPRCSVSARPPSFAVGVQASRGSLASAARAHRRPLDPRQHPA